MPKLITLTIDGNEVTVPEGTLIVDAAKQIGIDIPVFCYHPKMEPVGMCRMCLVDVGRPAVDRATGEVMKDESGKPKIQFAPKLDTACTTPVSAGMVVVGMSDKVQAARKDVLEFLLTSHPLDCPICDKGGECPLQNLTLAFGPGKSRFIWDEKYRLAKHVPLGELIFLDRERCIQCARCVRFQDELVDDPVIGFYQRGRALEIVTYSEPGFDSYFSGNTTDICPVGALTTSDFRFQARPWELQSAASICTHCPVGCNLTINVRREAAAGGQVVVKRIMPRQNEAVNEIWICDKGRFAHHFSQSPKRLTQPLLRKNGALVPVGWDEALEAAAGAIKANGDLVGLAGGRLPNEDLFNFSQLVSAQGGKAVLYSQMAGGDLTAKLGLGSGSNIGEMGKGTVIVVAACNLEEEAPIWYLRVRGAVKRGAALITVNPRATKLDKIAAHVVRYAYGDEVSTLTGLLPADGVLPVDGGEGAGAVIAAAENLVVFYGSEGVGLDGSQELATACANLLVAGGHFGKPNNGLVAAWDKANTQGAFDMGFLPESKLAETLAGSGVLLVAAADPAGDDPALADAVDGAKFVVVQELFLTETAQLADVVLPVQSFVEREGTFTSGERRVQRFYPAAPALAAIRPDYFILAEIGKRLGVALEGRAASLVMAKIAATVPAYAGLTYAAISRVEQQYPIVGRSDLYYGGTTYDNSQGLGVQLPAGAAADETVRVPHARRVTVASAAQGGLLAVPVTRLLDRGTTVAPTALLSQRIARSVVRLHPQDAERLGVDGSTPVVLALGEAQYSAEVVLDDSVPAGVALVPRSIGVQVSAPVGVTVSVPAVAGENVS